jgi:hypothetical protein
VETRRLTFFDISSDRILRTAIPAREVNLIRDQLRDDEGNIIASKSQDGHRWVVKRSGDPDFFGGVAFDDYRFE